MARMLTVCPNCLHSIRVCPYEIIVDNCKEFTYNKFFTTSNLKGNTMQTLKFNTGREYSPHGQRVIATLLDTGNIVIVDLDRHIDLMLLEGVGFNQREIMQAYDHAWTTFPEKINMSYSEYYDIVRELRELASA